ncbi:F-box/kelch-repeat protein at3g06240 [Phtheirospermum japonicum]|uniref:F-box/kelch-repeat protein at3g06240 n=1 Tax=Phtheirospermum japonicum TaxID=374723 RepID=A0A830BVI1_9LAMI|nr:F-box/kelch-repeat protein at3g06240 [Phtheirospermum japonicum]
MLPTVALVKFQCVCTSWRDLIRDPRFIKKHHQLASKGNIYLLHKPLQRNGHRVFRLLFDKTFDQALDIVLPLDLVPMSFTIVGSFNGVLCLADTNSFGTMIYICNPSIRKYRTINFPINDFTIGSLSNQIDVNIAFGFGYHDETDDYKIVRILSLPVEEDVAKNKVEVYSLTENLWKDVEADYFPWDLFDARSDIVVNESIHWKAIYQDSNEDILVILAFHLVEEVFRQLSVPDYLCDGEDLMEYVGVYKGNLSLFAFHLADQDPWDEKCYLWVMREYGVDTSWTKVQSVTISPGVVTPHTFNQNDEIVYDNGDDESVVYHFDTNTTRVLLGREDQGFLDLVTYMDSLVMLEG